MSLAKKLLSCSGVEDKIDASEVFSTYLYTGNGSTQTINNGIDLAGKGGMVWSKMRTGTYPHALVDTLRGKNAFLSSNQTDGTQNCTGDIASFNNNGITYNAPTNTNVFNQSGSSYVNWTFRRAPKFFDVVTYTGNGTAGRTISHNLGVAPGMVIIKKTSSAGDWIVQHRSLTSGLYNLRLNLTDAQGEGGFFSAFADDSKIYLGAADDLNNFNGSTYVAYLFAHDPSADGIIQCGSFVGNTTVTIGLEPQYIMIKRTDSTGDWIVVDSMRGCSVGGVDARLMPNLSSAESVANDYIDFTPTGFISKNLTGTYIYMVIRRPNKVPTSGTEVYNAIARTGTGAAATVTAGFPADLAIVGGRTKAYNGTSANWCDRLRGNNLFLESASTVIERTASASVSFDYMVGVNLGSDIGIWGFNQSNETYINHLFKRAKGFFDIVCYTGTGVARTVNHNLGVAPELMIVKSRSAAGSSWVVYDAFADFGVNNPLLVLGSTAARAMNKAAFNGARPTASIFSIGESGYYTNTLSATYVAYLFATLAGISKVGSYTGNGTSLNIDCGFTTGARFFLCKRTDSTGDWFIFDTVRGIVAANDPHLSLNTTAAEVITDDSVDPYSLGITVNQNTATNINVNGGTYIYLSIS